MDEHKAIERYLEILEIALERLESGKAVPKEVFLGIADFFETFVDRCHHGKEETLLFPKFQERGIPSLGGPIGQMLLEHEKGRKLANAYKAATERLLEGHIEAAPGLIEAGRAYTQLLKEHIHKENHVLYPMGARLLSAEDHATLISGFERIESERIGEGAHEGFHRLLEDLVGWVMGLKEE